MTNLEFNNHIAFLKLDNPPDNRLTEPEFIQTKQLDDFLTVNKAKALIISGTGRHFSSGADLETIQKQLADNTLNKKLTKGKALLTYIYKLNIPVIAAIEGACFGGGLEIALSSHIRVVSEKALIAFPESNLNLMPGLSGTHALKKFLSLGRSIEMLLEGNIINADKAIKMGLCDHICESKSSLRFSTELAQRMIKDKPLLVINNIMKALKNAYEMSKEEALEKETELFCELAKESL